MNFLPALSPLQWFLVALVPPAIVSLYFLKLKRQPVEVPSTYLWSRTIEDLHVNSIWQRLRQSLLLFLQILIVTLAILACLRPGWRGTDLIGDRFIFMVDTSASMSATDVSPSRLEAAKTKLVDLINQMESGDVAMVISFSDVPHIEQPFTGNRSELRQSVNKIKPTSRRSDIRDALRAAAGLANPGRTGVDATDVQVADALPADIYIFSDGRYLHDEGFRQGTLMAHYIKMGTEDPDNVGIVAFNTERNPEKPDQLQAFARIENYGPGDVTLDVSLSLDGDLLDARQLSVPNNEEEGNTASVNFDLQNVDDGVLKLQVDRKDDLMIDNAAYTALNTPRRARVLVVTPGNEALRFALTTELCEKLAHITFEPPDVLETREHQDLALAGAFDMIIYDQCAPQELPQCNTLFIGTLPPGDAWKAGEREFAPQVVDIERVHPLMEFVELGNVMIYDGTPLEPPEGATALVDADFGTLIAIAPRQSFEDAVMGFEIYGKYPEGDVGAKTKWVRRRSFPLFVMNVLKYLGGARGSMNTITVQPGRPVKVRTELPVEQVRIDTPAGGRIRLKREGQSGFVFSRTDQLGVYDIREGSSDEIDQRFSVNLFDGRESNLVPQDRVKLGREDVVGQSGSTPTRKEMWKWLLLFGLGVLIFEWYVYNRRVYL